AAGAAAPAAGPAPGDDAPLTAAEAALAEAAGLAVFSTVAHELRGPLMALATSAELLVADFDSLGPEQVREMVAGIHCRALWLQELVENLLCAASLREGRLAMHLQPQNLLEVVAEVRQVVLPLLRRRDQRLRILQSAPAGLPEVQADGRRLGQVLVNLILNASKFSPPGTSVEVTLGRQRNDALRVTVSDRGPGLPEGTVERLFEPFFRAPSTAVSTRAVRLGATAPEGVGLGLAIVKEIVARHGGSVGAGPRRGGGARFWFELPLL
ncbi:MAG TPA: ATP-binding protein, partial [Chloroflexota bacterium]|nr:ATP-binding protein [Chloroflexota bacterium]